jgi:threonyl-tRNA synthetase
MEKLMNYDWNVYRVFANGRRAKAPFHVFAYDDPDSVEEFFNAQIKENFTEKIRRSRLMILRSDLPQDRETDSLKKNQKILEERKRRIFRKYLRKLDLNSISHTSVAGGLIYCLESGWQWQWAALEVGTSRFLAPLSPPFTSYEAAQGWMDEEINNL